MQSMCLCVTLYISERLSCEPIWIKLSESIYFVARCLVEFQLFAVVEDTRSVQTCALLLFVLVTVEHLLCLFASSICLYPIYE